MNNIYLSGKTASTLKLSHVLYNNKFYSFNVCVKRRSGVFDLLPVIIPERTVLHAANCNLSMMFEGQSISLSGQVRTYNELENGKRRLKVHVFCHELAIAEEASFFENHVKLEGYICKRPYFHTSPAGREICDVLLAVNRLYGKSDYIPCIAWEKNAHLAEKLVIGQKICIAGRMQSRIYSKVDGGRAEQHTAYEISITHLEMLKG